MPQNRVLDPKRRTSKDSLAPFSPKGHSSPAALTGDAGRASEEGFRTLIELVPVAMYSCDADGVIQAINQHAVALWGRTPTVGDRDERFSGACKLFSADGQFMPHSASPMARVLRGETLDEHETELLVERPDGTRRHVIGRPRAVKDEHGNIVGAINCLFDITERKRAEAAAAHLAAIVTSAEDAIASKTLEGIVTSWNASAERMFGCTAQEMIGQPITRLFPPDRLDEEDLILARIRAGERLEHFETVRVTKDGRPIEVSLTISPIRDSAGTIIGASKIVRDISERKRADRLLTEQNHLLELIAAGRPLDECLIDLTRAVARLEPRTRAAVVLTNGAGTRVQSSHAADLAQSFGAGLTDAPLSDLVTETGGTALASGRPIASVDLAHDARWSPQVRDLCVAHDILASHAAPVLGPDGVPLGWLVLCFDMARAASDWELRLARFGTHLASIAIARDRAAQAVRESEEKFRTLADNIPTLAWMGHPDGHIFWYNRHWYNYTGTTPDSQEGWGWQSAHDPAVLPRVLERWRHSLATGEPFEMVFRLRGADGVLRPFLTRIIPVKDEQGQVVRWFGTGTDVSELRAAEEALRAANQRMDEFLHTATHELKTPVTAVQATLQLLERRLQRLLSAPPQSRRAASEALQSPMQLIARSQQQVRRLTRLVDDLVDAARIQADKLEIRPAPCDLAEIVWEAVTEQRAVRPERAIHLDVAVPEGQPLPVEADADRIGQVVTNYLTNALKYSPEESPVEVTLQVEGGVARVSVRDHGPGIPTEEQARVWERGHRVPGIEATGEGVGLGLGLHISREIVERHGGQVGVESVVGHGSTFWFNLPLSDAG